MALCRVPPQSLRMAPFKEALLKNWKTTVQPVLTVLLVIFGALAEHEVSLGHIGKGTVVSFVVAVLKGVIGALQKD